MIRTYKRKLGTKIYNNYTDENLADRHTQATAAKNCNINKSTTFNLICNKRKGNPAFFIVLTVRTRKNSFHWWESSLFNLSYQDCTRKKKLRIWHQTRLNCCNLWTSMSTEKILNNWRKQPRTCGASPKPQFLMLLKKSIDALMTVNINDIL